MNREFTITSNSLPNLLLRTIVKSDCESLRKWKNDNKSSFFYQKTITSNQQLSWFNFYLTRENDYMFIVQEKRGEEYFDIGCIGFRILDSGIVDIYNVIRASKRTNKGISMKDAMKLLCSYIMSEFSPNMSCKVLSNNPAVQWYEKCGFIKNKLVKNGYSIDYYDMYLNISTFKPCDFVIS